MFKSNRYLLFASLVGILSIAALVFFYRHLASTSLMEHETHSNLALTQVFSNSIWPDYAQFVKSAKNTPLEQLPTRPEILRLDAAVRQQMHGSNVVKVKIYDLSGLTVYSSDPSQIGQKKSNNAGFLSAKTGEPASNITFRNRFDAFEGIIEKRNVVSSYIPIYSSAVPDKVDAVFEVYSDVTNLVQALERTQWQIVIGVLSILSLVYIMLVGIARKADRIAKNQLEEKLSNEAKIHYQTYHDSVTGLPNRNSFIKHLHEAISQAERQDKVLGVLFLDLDKFKLVNDSFGHEAGDKLLQVTASRLHGCVRDCDMLFRMGGDEFSIIPEGLEYPEGMIRLARRILKVMEEPVTINGHTVIVTISIGISVFPKDDVEPEKLVKNADAAMYLAKESGRNQYQLYTPEMSEQALYQLDLESALTQALKNGEYLLHYQPRYAADTLSIVGMEALIRWQRRDGHLEPPLNFIPTLEQTGLINSVGKWVLYTACKQNKAWQNDGFPPLRVSVNVSSMQFLSKDFMESMTEILSSTGLDPQYLELELTESVLLNNPEGSIRLMEQIRALGISISIDDFGTGYSSFSYLKLLPVTHLKIDRTFVKNVTRCAKDIAIVKAISTLASSLNIGLVAEGVEEQAQIDLLIQYACTEFQGFFLSRPLDVKSATQLLRRKSFAEVPSLQSC